MKIALAITSKFILTYGVNFTIEKQAFSDYPPPEVLTRLNTEELRNKLHITRTKAKALIEVGRAEIEKRLPSLTEIFMDPEKAIEDLSAIYGIGPWTAKLAIAMVRDDFWIGPAEDLAVKRGLKFFLGEKQAEQVFSDASLRNYYGLIMYLLADEYEVTYKKKPRKK